MEETEPRPPTPAQVERVRRVVRRALLAALHDAGRGPPGGLSPPPAR